jgi:hypothetical protein
MRPGAVLVQASRGDIVDEAALADCLTSGHLGGAAVDVYASEPPRRDNPLLALQGDAGHRLLLTPHIAGVTRQAWASLFRAAWRTWNGRSSTAKPRSIKLLRLGTPKRPRDICGSSCGYVHCRALRTPSMPRRARTTNESTETGREQRVRPQEREAAPAPTENVVPTPLQSAQGALC